MITITVDPALCSARVSGVVCLGTLFDFEVKFESGTADDETSYSEAVIVLFSDDNVALNTAPTVSAAWGGKINLATSEAVALFTGKKPNDKVTATVGVWNSTDGRMLGTGSITIKNNPFMFSSNIVNELLLAEFASRVAILENRSGKVPDLNTGDWVGLYARTTDGVRQLTFEETV